MCIVFYKNSRISKRHKKTIESDWYNFFIAIKRKDVNQIVKFGNLLKENKHMDSIHLNIIYDELLKFKSDNTNIEVLKLEISRQLRRWKDSNLYFTKFKSSSLIEIIISDVFSKKKA